MQDMYGMGMGMGSLYILGVLRRGEERRGGMLVYIDFCSFLLKKRW